MSKKSNPDKGLRSVTIDFAGEPRELKFTHSAVGNFEEDANHVLRSMGVIQAGNMVFAEGLMNQWLGNARIFSMALYHGLDKALKVSEVDAGIDAYIQAGGNKTDLGREIIRAFKRATDPSSLASLERSWKASDQRKAKLTEIDNKRMDAIEAALQDAVESMTNGSPTSGSPESS